MIPELRIHSPYFRDFSELSKIFNAFGRLFSSRPVKRGCLINSRIFIFLVYLIFVVLTTFFFILC
jgi:hypothetical protein